MDDSPAKLKGQSFRAGRGWAGHEAGTFGGAQGWRSRWSGRSPSTPSPARGAGWANLVVASNCWVGGGAGGQGVSPVYPIPGPRSGVGVTRRGGEAAWCLTGREAGERA